MDWNFLWGILIALAAVGFGLFTLWECLRKGYDDYISALMDGTITDDEKIKLADDLIKAIEQTRTVWTFVLKLIALTKKK